MKFCRFCVASPFVIIMVRQVASRSSVEPKKTAGPKSNVQSLAMVIGQLVNLA